jgi:nicotinate phosphoribosyltransferase
MQQGGRTLPPESLERMAERCRRDLGLLPNGCRRFVNPHRYKVSISPQLKELRCAMIRAVGTRMK